MSSDRNQTHKKLVIWFRKQLVDQTEERPLTKITLRHASSSKHPVTEIKNAGKMAPESMASMVLESAYEDAEGLGGVQRYVALSYFAEEHPGERIAFRAYVENAEDEEDEFASDPASAKGIIAQTMRHTEIMTRQAHSAVAETNRHNQRIIERQDARINDLEMRHVEMLTAYEQVILQRDDKEMQRLRLDAEIKQRDALLGKLALLVPHVANKLAGKNVMPAQSPEAMALRELLESITPQQLEVLTGSLKPEQGLLVLDLFKKFGKPELPPGNGIKHEAKT